MNIVVTTKFWPSIGGIETLAQTLADAWVHLGHQVTIVTDIPYDGKPDKFGFSVVRNPSFSRFLSITRGCDVFVQNNISLKSIWPVLLARKPLVAVHHGFYRPFARHQPSREKAKVAIARHFTTNISVSNAIRERIRCGGHVIPNLYNSHVFKHNPSIHPDRDIVFVGRLVSEKGLDLLIDAMVALRNIRIRPLLTIIGDGPERPAIEHQIHRHRLGEQVEFAGAVEHSQIPTMICRHRIMAIPSKCDEAFGIVALEGAACGCVVVGSSGGGLPEAIGPCGPTFTSGCLSELIAVLKELLENKKLQSKYRAAADAHLAKHQISVIAEQYIDVFASIVRS